jgi:hypothetical protein
MNTTLFAYLFSMLKTDKVQNPIAVSKFQISGLKRHLHFILETLLREMIPQIHSH